MEQMFVYKFCFLLKCEMAFDLKVNFLLIYLEVYKKNH